MLTVEEGRRYLGVMPAIAEHAMGAKLVSFYPGNAGSGVPTHHAMILLFGTRTGEPLAVLDGRLITEMRTAAVSAAATKHLAHPDSRVLALLGSGVQAEAHLHALQRVRNFEEVRVWSRTAEHARRFAERHGIVAMAPEGAVRGADVVVTATSAIQPILKGAWLKGGAHVNAVGSPRPNWRELDDAAMANLLVVDSRAAVMKESGDVILSKAKISAEIGEVFAGTASVSAEATTVFQIGRDRGRGYCRSKARLRASRCELNSFPGGPTTRSAVTLATAASKTGRTGSGEPLAAGGRGRALLHILPRPRGRARPLSLGSAAHTRLGSA